LSGFYVTSIDAAGATIDLAALAMIRTAMLLASLATVLSAQAPDSEPLSSSAAFERVSIRSNDSRGRRPTRTVTPAGAIALTNMPVRELIAEAYGIPATLARLVIVGGRDWLMDARYDVNATVAPDTPPDRQRLMLRAFLADRFALRTHVETRELPVYAVTRARDTRLGPQLRPSKYNCPAYLAAAASAGRNPATDRARPRDANGRAWCAAGFVLGPRGELVIRGAGAFRDLLDQVQGFANRPLVDRTGIEGNVEWVVRFVPVHSSTPADASTTAFASAFEKQLGVQLEPQTASMEVRVIDSIQPPMRD
jgi:uncharacterized protein (TIGR03435 family)